MALKGLTGLKGLKGLRGLKGSRRRLAGLDPLPEPGDLLEVDDPRVREWAKTLGGDERLAKRMVSYTGEYPVASLPELVTLDWLRGKNYFFLFQAQFFGGRGQRGGSVPDFVVSVGGDMLVWRVQGEYWHTRPGKRGDDLNEKLQMLASGFEGRQVRAVVDLWENDVYTRRPEIFNHALAGDGLRD